MPEVELKLGAKMNLLSQDELDATLAARIPSPESNLRATDGLWIPVLNKIGTNPFTMGGDTGTLIQGPLQGYSWSIRRLIITGMTRTALPRTSSRFCAGSPVRCCGS